MTPERPRHLQTRVVTAGRPELRPDAPLNPPVVFASTYVGSNDAEQSMGYGRYDNPTWQALERAVGDLEGGRALIFASGMAAAHAILDLVPPGGRVVMPTTCYLGIAAAIGERAGRDRLEVRPVSVADAAAVVRAADGADLVWLETPTNPTIEVADLPAIGAAVRGRALLVVDNTFATPLVQRPLEHGADLVLHSATKFLSGHADAVLGAVVGRADDPRLADLRRFRSSRGAVPGPMEAYLVLRGLRTLGVRLDRAQHNAQVLAERLAKHPAVRAVRYPGLIEDPGHATARRTLAGFGAVLAVELADAATADAMVGATTVWVFTTSLGGVESTLERRRRWASELDTVPEGLVRLSVGIEHVEDLWADLEQALARATG